MTLCCKFSKHFPELASSAVTTLLLPLISVLMDLELPCCGSVTACQDDICDIFYMVCWFNSKRICPEKNGKKIVWQDK